MTGYPKLEEGLRPRSTQVGAIEGPSVRCALCALQSADRCGSAHSSALDVRTRASDFSPELMTKTERTAFISPLLFPACRQVRYACSCSWLSTFVPIFPQLLDLRPSSIVGGLLVRKSTEWTDGLIQCQGPEHRVMKLLSVPLLRGFI